MSITDYFTTNLIKDKKNEKKVNSQISLLLKLVTEFREDDIIDLKEYIFVLQFIKKYKSITLFNKLNDFNTKLKKNAQQEKYLSYKKIFDDVFKKFIQVVDNPKKFVVNVSKEGKLLIFSDDQRDAIIGIMDFLYKKDQFVYGLYGYAGSGKTTLITRLINYLSVNKYIKKAVFTAPTNKAVNVMKSKYNVYDTNTESIHFTTIHQLLNYGTDYDDKGSKVFVKKGPSKILLYDIVVIDECSMISNDIVKDIFREIKNPPIPAKNDIIKVPKVLFIGDPAQLPPVNEESSIIFNYDINSIIMKDIMRNDNENVINLCNDIRKWVIDGISPQNSKHKGGKVHFYKCKDKNNKLDTKWFRKCTSYFKKDDKYGNIVLTWTNKQSDIYNTEIRKKMLNKKDLERFEIGDILVFKNFYKLGDDKKFYTSEQIKIVDIENVVKCSGRFTSNLKLPKTKNMPFIKQKIKNCVDQINRSTMNRYETWKIHIKPLLNGNDNCIDSKTYTIYVLKNDPDDLLDMDKAAASSKINQLRYELQSTLRDQINYIDAIVIKRMWKQYNEIYTDPFASVSISTSITVHRSQGSTYHNVFVDADDIFNNPNQLEGRRCMYTALTRAANEINVLV